MSDKLSAKQKRALAALLVSNTKQEAADLAGVSKRSISRWLADKSFRAALSEVQSQLLDQASARLAGLQSDALAKLSDLLHSDKEHISIKAVDMIISYSLKFIEMRELERRLSDLEAQL